MTDSQELCDLADAHLPPEIASRWKRLLRPAVQFDWAAGNDLVAAQLGGDPELPIGQPWPEREGHGPLSFIIAVDCAQVTIPDFPLPESGKLLFFYFDGQIDAGAEVVGVFKPGSQDGARILFVPEETVTERRAAPEPLKPYPPQLLRAKAVTTAPESESPWIDDAFGDAQARGPAHPVDDEEFIEEVYEELLVDVCHQIGGHPMSVQNPVEYEPRDFDLTEDESERWLLLAQIDCDLKSNMDWGAGGMLYWLIREGDLAAARFDRAVFTWQC